MTAERRMSASAYTALYICCMPGCNKLTIYQSRASVPTAIVVRVRDMVQLCEMLKAETVITTAVMRLAVSDLKERTRLDAAYDACSRRLLSRTLASLRTFPRRDYI